MRHKMDIQRIAGIIILGGSALTLLSLLAGFFFLFSDQDDLAKRLLGLVPIGFLLVFTGLVTTVLSGPRSDDPR